MVNPPPQISTCNISKGDLLEILLKENGNLVCLANGQTRQLFASQKLFLSKEENKVDTLFERCPRRWCQGPEEDKWTKLHDAFFGISR